MVWSLLLSRRFVSIIYVGVITLAAFLLFQVQPIIGKYLLPWFGGSSSVWMVLMFFFQCLLLGGYTYSHLLVKFPKKVQLIVHFSLLLAGLMYMYFFAQIWSTPITPSASWKPIQNSMPMISLLHILITCIGLPFFILSSTSSLMQYWYGRMYPGKSPYYFYSFSNVASVFALVSYPFLLEPFLSVMKQASVWSFLFSIYAIGFLCSLILFYLSKSCQDETETELEIPDISGKLYLVWIGYPLCASVLLLAITNHLTMNIANIPFLWIAPLTIYLLSFIITFSSKDLYNRRLLSVLYIAISIVLMAVLMFPAVFHLFFQIFICLVHLFIACLLCHGEVYRLRPDPKDLTIFYFCISLGGALGGVIVNLIAPIVFDMYLELYIALFISIIISIKILRGKVKQNVLPLKKSRYILMVEVAIIVICMAYFFNAFSTRTKSLLDVKRNFYGVIQITQKKIYGSMLNIMINGHTVHGVQYVADNKKRIPTTYYSQDSGVGQLLSVYRKAYDDKPVRVGAIGLGVGTIASYASFGDYYCFYEINPQVVSKAKKYFSYLSDSKANVDVRIGDGRLLMERELVRGDQQKYHIIVVDAFTGGAIPAHLLTTEAFSIYNDYIDPGRGVLAFHISNKYFNLTPLLANFAAQYSYNAKYFATKGDGIYSKSSVWIVMSKDSFLVDEYFREQSQPGGAVRLWTDDYSNLFDILR